MAELTNEFAAQKRSKKAKPRLSARQLSVAILIVALLRALVELASAILTLLD